MSTVMVSALLVNPDADDTLTAYTAKRNPCCTVVTVLFTVSNGVSVVAASFNNTP